MGKEGESGKRSHAFTLLRPIWKGNISFGLVYVPVAVYAAIREESLGFRELRKKDLSSLSPAPQLSIYIYVGPGAQKVWTLETSPNPAGLEVSVGTAVRVPE